MILLNKEILDIIEKSRQEHNTKNTLFLDKYIKYYNMPIEDNVFLYESFAGAGLIDNPYAIFLELKKRSDFDKYTHVWVLRDFRENNFNFIEYAGCPNVKFIKYGSDDYLKYISIAKILINNCTFPTYWTKKPG